MRTSIYNKKQVSLQEDLSDVIKEYIKDNSDINIDKLLHEIIDVVKDHTRFAKDNITNTIETIENDITN